MRPSRSEHELNEIALAIFKGEIFTDRQTNDLAGVFTFFSLMPEDQLQQFKNDPPGMIFQYLTKAAPLSCNGQPMFFSAELLNVEDAKTVWEKYGALKLAAQTALAI